MAAKKNAHENGEREMPLGVVVDGASLMYPFPGRPKWGGPGTIVPLDCPLLNTELIPAEIRHVHNADIDSQLHKLVPAPEGSTPSPIDFPPALRLLEAIGYDAVPMHDMATGAPRPPRRPSTQTTHVTAPPVI